MSGDRHRGRSGCPPRMTLISLKLTAVARPSARQRTQALGARGCAHGVRCIPVIEGMNLVAASVAG